MSAEPSNAAIMQAITKLGGEFGDLRGEVREMHEALVGFQQAVSIHFGVVETDVAGLKTDVAGLKSDVAGLKRDVGIVKSDTTALRYQVSELQEWSKKTDARLDNIERRRRR